MSQTIVKPCNCESKYQDETYGKKLRLHNQTRKSKIKEQASWRCTVCGKDK